MSFGSTFPLNAMLKWIPMETKILQQQQELHKFCTVLKILAELPEEYRDFHAGRMVLHIQDKAYSKKFE